MSSSRVMTKSGTLPSRCVGDLTCWRRACRVVTSAVRLSKPFESPAALKSPATTNLESSVARRNREWERTRDGEARESGEGKKRRRKVRTGWEGIYLLSRRSADFGYGHRSQDGSSRISDTPSHALARQ